MDKKFIVISRHEQNVYDFEMQTSIPIKPKKTLTFGRTNDEGHAFSFHGEKWISRNIFEIEVSDFDEYDSCDLIITRKNKGKCPVSVNNTLLPPLSKIKTKLNDINEIIIGDKKLTHYYYKFTFQETKAEKKKGDLFVETHDAFPSKNFKIENILFSADEIRTIKELAINEAFYKTRANVLCDELTKHFRSAILITTSNGNIYGNLNHEDEKKLPEKIICPHKQLAFLENQENNDKPYSGWYFVWISRYGHPYNSKKELTKYPIGLLLALRKHKDKIKEKISPETICKELNLRSDILAMLFPAPAMSIEVLPPDSPEDSKANNLCFVAGIDELLGENSKFNTNLAYRFAKIIGVSTDIVKEGQIIRRWRDSKTKDLLIKLHEKPVIQQTIEIYDEEDIQTTEDDWQINP